MADNKIYVIGIGGTGMRCVESFIHLCAMGMYDNTEVNILALDTDITNGNFKRVKELADKYQTINGGNASANTFFSAKINYYEFSPKYEDRTTFASVAKYEKASQNKSKDGIFKESDIADLFISPGVRDMSLRHGYRAQTQMGSMLMYHAIIQEANRAMQGATRSQLRDFLSGLTIGTGHKVFIFGSVFGGTGASSIPILPHALDVASQIMFEENSSVLRGNYFGSVVLTSYFKFTDMPKGNEIVAKSSKFALNSQAALKFYCSDPTVQQTYKRLYLIGRQTQTDLPKEAGVDTGGEKQKNPVDFIELLAAFAAYDFFRACDTPEKLEPADNESRFFFMQAGDDERLDFINFTDDTDKFRERFGSFVAAAMTNARGDFFRQMANQYFKSIREKEELEVLNGYMNLFYDAAEHTGWAQQLFDSAGGKGLLFHDEVFDKGIDIRKKKYNERMFAGDSAAKFSTKGLFGDTLFDTIRDTFAKKTDASKDETMSHLLERTFATFQNLYFNK